MDYTKVAPNFEISMEAYTRAMAQIHEKKPPKASAPYAKGQRIATYDYHTSHIALWQSDNTMVVFPMKYGDYLDCKRSQSTAGIIQI